jgi:hypothetical protein
MNKEQQELLDEVYENYLNNFIKPICPPNLDVQPDYYKPMTKEWFVKSAKERGLRGEEFSEKWGLKIEERELRQFERVKLLHKAWKNNGITPEHEEVSTLWVEYLNQMEKYNIPTQIIIVTYQDQKIESYE